MWKRKVITEDAIYIEGLAAIDSIETEFQLDF